MPTVEDQENLYRMQLMDAFNIDYTIMTSWDDLLIEEVMNTVYLNIKENAQFRALLDAAKYSPNLGMTFSIMHQNDEDAYNKIDALVFSLLFNYDYFDLFHKCICEYINNGIIKTATFNELMNRF